MDDMYNSYDVLLSFFITVLIYVGPILIYRFGIKKAPVPKKKARKIAIINAIIGIILLSVVLIYLDNRVASGGPALLYGFINYWLLHSGYSEESQTENNNIQNKVNNKSIDAPTSEKNNMIDFQHIYDENIELRRENTYLKAQIQKLLDQDTIKKGEKYNSLTNGLVNLLSSIIFDNQINSESKDIVFEYIIQDLPEVDNEEYLHQLETIKKCFK